MHYCSLNGKIIPETEAKISALDNGFLFGWGIYETLRTANKKVLNWKNHWERLLSSLEKAQIKARISEEEILSSINELIDRNPFNEHRIRITISAGNNNQPTILITTNELKLPTPEQYQEGIKILTTVPQRPMPHIKSTSLIAYKLIDEHLKELDFYEAIFIDNRGFVLEGNKSNICFVKAGKIFSPKPENKLLPGTTLKIIESFPTEINYINFDTSVLYEADEVFITNSIIGVLPVKQIEQKNFQIGPVTRKIQSDYEQYLFLYQNLK